METEWSKLITDLEATGLSLKEIADDVGASQQAISEVKQGRSKEPRGMVAVQLHALHDRVCVKEKAA